jgi:hypothetical protein
MEGRRRTVGKTACLLKDEKAEGDIELNRLIKL